METKPTKESYLMSGGLIALGLSLGATTMDSIDRTIMPNANMDKLLGGFGQCKVEGGNAEATSNRALASECFKLLGETEGAITVQFNRADGRGSFVLRSKSGGREIEIFSAGGPSPGGR